MKEISVLELGKANLEVFSETLLELALENKNILAVLRRRIARPDRRGRYRRTKPGRNRRWPGGIRKDCLCGFARFFPDRSCLGTD